MAEESGVDVRLADVLRALTAEVGRAHADQGSDGSDLRVEAVTVELDVALEAGHDGEVGFWVGKVQGATKRAKTTRMSVTLRAPAAAAGEDGPSAGERGTTTPVETVVGEVAPPEARPLGLVDVLADALKTIADTASRSAGPGWPPRPGGSGPDASGRGPVT